MPASKQWNEQRLTKGRLGLRRRQRRQQLVITFLLLLVRETPLHLGHLRMMVAATESGAIIAPPVPAFYPHPKSVDDIVDYTARRALARVGLPDLAPAPWDGDLGGLNGDESG